jgi:IclR family acetate operon transcriptional repressor
MDRVKPSMVEKALDVLELLLARPDGLRASELGETTGYPSGTLHRLLGVLVRRGFARQDPISRRYLVGAQLSRAASAVPSGSGLSGLALPHLKGLAQSTGLAVNLGVLRGDRLVVLESVVASHESGGPVLYTPPGTLMPPHCTAMGKVQLADLSEPELERWLQRTPRAQHTPQSITDAAHLTEHLVDVRRRGYAIDDQEFNVGVRCVAGGVRDASGQVVGAISVTASIHELPWSEVPAVADRVRVAAAALTLELGGHAAGLAQRAV